MKSERLQLQNSRMTCRAVLLTLMLSLGSSGVAQTPDEHAGHHPGAPPETSSAPNSTDAVSPMPSSPDATAADGMKSMMDGMMRTPRKELYPSMIELSATTPRQRAELEQLARARMLSGAALMAAGVERLNSSASSEDYAAMKEAAARTREGVAQFESGVATLQALSGGSAPRDIALGWFRSNMGLAPSAEDKNPHGFFGLNAFHYFTMLILLVVSAVLVWMNFSKMRRAQVLIARLAGGPQTATSPDAPVVPLAPSALVAPNAVDAPSKPNSWTGLLRVARIFEETSNVRTLRLVELTGNELPFRHLPGQFVTFTVKPIDQTIRRSYTIASSPTRRDYCEVTIKREEKGTVSSFLHHVHEGDTLQVTGPSGNFTFVGEGANSIVLISGGVGITPMMSVLRFLTDRSWAGDIFFLHGCKSDQDVIYREELEYLQRRYPNLHLTLAANEVTSTGWAHSKGGITQDLLSQAVPHIQTRRIHLCGPPGMMAAMKSMLAEMGMPADQIKSEVFIGRERPVSVADGTPGLAQAASAAGAAETAARGDVAMATFARSKRTALLPPNKTVLEAAEDVGVSIEYSCRVGVCGLCKVKLLSGAVAMEVQEGLTAQDKESSIILACQAKSAADVSVDA